MDNRREFGRSRKNIVLGGASDHLIGTDPMKKEDLAGKARERAG